MEDKQMNGELKCLLCSLSKLFWKKTYINTQLTSVQWEDFSQTERTHVTGTQIKS